MACYAEHVSLPATRLSHGLKVYQSETQGSCRGATKTSSEQFVTQKTPTFSDRNAEKHSKLFLGEKSK